MSPPPSRPACAAGRWPARPLIGAEIAGVDLTGPVDEGTAQALREAFWIHKVLVFRGRGLPSLHGPRVYREVIGG
jgi:alpha-ketoglutarate-dependent taurine dioxygenase